MLLKVKVKVSQCAFLNRAPRHEVVLGEWRYRSTHSLTSALDGGELSASRPGRFTPRKRARSTHWIGGWVAPKEVLGWSLNKKLVVWNLVSHTKRRTQTGGVRKQGAEENIWAYVTHTNTLDAVLTSCILDGYLRVNVLVFPRVVTGEKNSPTVVHARRKRRLKWVLGAWEYNWATQSPGDTNMETWSSRLGVGAQG
jgi:hypothetical protein